MSNWKLVDQDTRAELAIGDERTTFRNGPAKIESLQPPDKPGSTGRVYVRFGDGSKSSGLFPGVVNAEFVDLDTFVDLDADADTYQAGERAYQARDFVEAVRIWTPLAVGGDSRAQVGLAVCLMYGGVGVGRLVRNDYVQAIEWLGKAAAQGDANALFHLGQCAEQGRGIPRDELAALDFFRRSAERGNPSSQMRMASRYLNGQGVLQDDRLAVAWLRKAAEKGWTPSLLLLGSLFLGGRGVQKDIVMAHVCYEVAGGRKSDDPREPSDLYFVRTRLSGEQKAEAESLIAALRSGNPLPMQSITGLTTNGQSADD